MGLVVWDWNGTLLNDVLISHNIFNEFLNEQDIPSCSLPEFQALYRHPIIEMYHLAGYSFDNESFVEMSTRWYARYTREVAACTVFDDAHVAIQAFNQKNFQQIIVSALEQTALHQQVKKVGLWEHFNQISGHHDLGADSKVARAQKVFQESGFKPHEIVVIGDTSHDAEVAVATGAHCVLVANGYEDAKRLAQTGFRVTGSLNEAAEAAAKLLHGES